VWIKNFLAGSLAGAVGGVAINLTVDNDAGHAMDLQVPTRSQRRGGRGGGPEVSPHPHPLSHGGERGDDADTDEVRMATVMLAAVQNGVAMEELPASALRPEAVEEALAVLPGGPMADALRRSWNTVAAAARETQNLAEALAVGRRRLEEELGLVNMELPVSRLADGDAFRLFVAEMLRRREDFFGAYNDSLAEYRRVYRERSAAQPVPDLVRDGPRLEMPLWIWRAGERRQRLYVEPAEGGRLRLMAGRDEAAVLSAADVENPTACAARLAELRRAGWKVRPRALAMTFFTRLAVGDVFIHGLGGALYDKITDGMFERLCGGRAPEPTFSRDPAGSDQVSERLCGGRAPELVLASCTVHLPLEAYPSTARDLETARRAVRDWQHNPDRKLDAAIVGRPEVAALIAEKRRLVSGEREPTREGCRRAWQRVHEINAALAALDAGGARQAAADLVRTVRELRYNAILQSRECAFWLYPPEDLAAFYREAVRVP
jgi:hypothetical protein